jgi:hypothetical protein
MTLKRKTKTKLGLAAAILAASTGTLFAFMPTASAASGVLAPAQPCPTRIASWTFHTGRYNEEAHGLTLRSEVDRSCNYIAARYNIFGQGIPDQEFRNRPTTITKGSIYPTVHL